MRTSLRKLLQGAIDYAGLYPPAQLGMSQSVDEYFSTASSGDSWILGRFVCSASRLGELAQELRSKGTSPLSVTVVGSPLEGDPGARLRHDAIEIEEAESRGLVQVEAYEVKIDPLNASAAAGAVKRLPALLNKPGINIYLEVGWGPGMVDAMHDAASAIEGVGFKGRTGGVAAEQFPSSEHVASFVSECAALEAPFKFTAGLHQPLRHEDSALGVLRHGFLNVILASAAAVSQELSRREIQAILDTRDPSDWHFGADDVKVGEHWLEAEAIDDFLEVFGGFGSCSIQEPLEGLRSLNLIEKVGA